jgi:hypothetical protein
MKIEVLVYGEDNKAQSLLIKNSSSLVSELKIALIQHTLMNEWDSVSDILSAIELVVSNEKKGGE